MTTSHSSSRYYRSSEGQPGSVVWFISFGDLLTLLLCFFLVLTPWDRLKEAGKSQSVQPTNLKTEAHQNHGTTFASVHPLRGSVVRRELPIFARELETDDAGMFRALQEDLEGASLGDDRIEVIVCSPAEERARVVYGLREMFKRVVRGDVSVRFLVTPRCDASAVLAPVTERYLGRIRVLRM